MDIKFKELFLFAPKSKIKAGEGKEKGRFPFYTSSQIQNKWIDTEQHFDEALIFGTGGSASIHFEDEPFSTSTDCFVTISRKENVNTKYVYYYLSSNIHILEQGFKGAGLKHISKKYIEDILIPLPDLEFQNKVVAILDRSKAILDKRYASITKYEELIRATFLKMFGDPYFNKKKFPVDSLSNLCHFITKGTTPRGDKIFDKEFENSIPYLKVYHIVNGTVDFFHNPSYISTNTHDELNRSKVFPNDVLMNIVGPPLGKIGLVPDTYSEWNVNQAIIFFRVKERLLPSFLLNVLKSETLLTNIIRQATGVRQLNLSLKQCREIIIPVPPISYQQEFDKLFNKYKGIVDKLRIQQKIASDLVASLANSIFSEKITIDVDAELEALINAIDLERKDEENKIDTIVNDVTFIQRLIDRLNEQEFEDKFQYDKAKYILFRIMNEEEVLIKQIYKDNKVQLTLLNETP